MKKMMKKNVKKIVIVVLSLTGICLAGFLTVIGINLYMINSVSDRILTTEEATLLNDVDCAIVLGCLVWDDGTPSMMLADRIKRGDELYETGAVPKLLMSGDHGQNGYDEVNTMKKYAMKEGIPSSDIFMDHAGFSTYETMYRAKEVFAADTVIIVTQEYHLYRSLYIAGKLGLNAYGVPADYHVYQTRYRNEAREFLARVKDFISSQVKPLPTYLGEVIPISGDGDLTND